MANAVSTRTMKAVLAYRYGPPESLHVGEVGMPTIAPDQVLVRVGAAAVNPADLHSLQGRPYVVRLATGLGKPRHPVPGRVFAGTIDATGMKVSRFQAGDEVYGEAAGGGYAEYVAVKETLPARMPGTISHDQAAAVPLAGVTALQGLRDKGRVRPGNRVLINGASGGVGTMAVQIARALGAEVTAVCSNGAIEMMASLGADHVIDYTGEDFTLGDPGYDMIFDLVGNRSLAELRRALAPQGTLVMSSGPPSPAIRRILKAAVVSPWVGQRLTPLLQTTSRDDLETLTEMIEAGEVTPVVDRVFPLEEAAEAFRHLHRGHARGRTVIGIPQPGDGDRAVER